MSAIESMAHELLQAIVFELERDPTLVTRIRTALGIAPAADTQATPDSEVLFATAKAYAARVQVSLRTVRTWIANGLPTVGAGRLVRIDVKRADAWLASQSDSGIADRARRDVARSAARRALHLVQQKGGE